MKQQSMGEMISSLRKEKGMTQKDLADKMNVTDKAVSKWERNLSYPDINSIPTLAEVLGVSVDVLLNATSKEKEEPKEDIVNLILKAVPIAMGVAVTVLTIIDELPVQSGFTMLGIGLGCIGVYLLKN